MKLPNEPEINKSIEFIIEEGLVKKESFYTYLKKMIKTIRGKKETEIKSDDDQIENDSI